jgi:hypothetical protein
MADDSYLSIAAIANDDFMCERMNACATQQAHLGNAPVIANDLQKPIAAAAVTWVTANNYLWAGSPGWGAAWDSALAGHPNDDTYEPGKDPACITDAMILSTVQALTAE